MKKFTAIKCALLFLTLLMPATVFAGVCTENCAPVTALMNDFNDMLTATGDYAGGDTIPADEINKDLKTSQEAAKAWHSDAFLGRFSYYHRPGSMDTFEFTWLSAGDKTKMFLDTNSAPPEEKENSFTHHNGIFRVPMRLRDLTKIMSEDEKLLSTLDEVFTTNKVGYGYAGDTNFVLEKNAANKLMWTVTIQGLESSYIVKVSADNKQSPFFLVFKNNSTNTTGN